MTLVTSVRLHGALVAAAAAILVTPETAKLRPALSIAFKVSVWFEDVDEKGANNRSDALSIKQ